MMENEKLQVLLSKMTVKQKVAQLLQLNPFTLKRIVMKNKLQDQ